jgi:hypothetical protein
MADALMRMEWNDAAHRLTLRHGRDGGRLLECSAPDCMQPAFDGRAAAPVLDRVARDGAAITLHYRSDAVDAFRVTLCAEGDVLDMACRFTARQDCRLNRLSLFPAGTMLNLYRVINFRNRHFTEATWPELPLDREGCETDTFSEDWQFAPHPTALLFRKLEAGLFCGLLDVDQSYGMVFKAGKLAVEHWYLNYGEGPHGLPLKAGETFVSPTVRLFVHDAASPYDTYARFGRMLVESGRIPDPLKRPRIPWHQENLYCTWIDQVYASRSELHADLKDQFEHPCINAHKALTGAFVRKAVSVIRDKRLPIRTILIDAGWEVLRGDWRVNTERFPDMRALVDALHAEGFKVVVWWNWCELLDGVGVPSEQLMGGGARNRHGMRMRDYSKPCTQAYLRDLFHTLFAPDPGCCDLDGVKTDYQADKVHPDLPPEDPAWRGEINYFCRVYDLFYTEMRKHKPDAVHIGGSGCYHLSPWIDIIRTYDVHSSNFREHEARARMLNATSGGTPVAYDMHNFVENLDGWFASARRMDASVQVGNVMSMREDGLSPIVPADAAYWDRLRAGLEQTGKGPDALRSGLPPRHAM